MGSHGNLIRLSDGRSLFKEKLASHRHVRLALLAYLLTLFYAPQAHAQFPPASLTKNPFILGVPVDLSVPMAPSPFQGTDHRRHLAYELHISSFSKTALVLEQIQVLDESGELVASYSGKDLASRLDHAAGQLESQNLPAKMRAVVFIWLDIDDAVPRNLRHRLFLFIVRYKARVAALCAI